MEDDRIHIHSSRHYQANGVKNGTPFSATGVDHLGPVHMKDVYDVSEEETLHQSFITLYTCATSRGIVLDLVRDTSSNCFISSCIKFISRRGCPQICLSIR